MASLAKKKKILTGMRAEFGEANQWLGKKKR